MKFFFSVAFVLMLQIVAKAQQSLSKPVIDSSAYLHWAAVDGIEINSDGRYVAYGVHDDPVGTNNLVIQSTTTDYKVVIQNMPGFSAQFTADGSHVVFMKKDTLGVLRAGSSTVKYIPDVSAFTMADIITEGWIAYMHSDARLVLTNLSGKEMVCFNHVITYLFTPANALLARVKNPVGSAHGEAIIWYDPRKRKADTIWRGTSVKSIAVDKINDGRLAFLAGGTNVTDSLPSVFYWRKGMDNAAQMLEGRRYFDDELEVAEIAEFAGDNICLLRMQKKSIPENPVAASGLKLHIWSYLDHQLEPQYRHQQNEQPYYLAALHLGTKNMVRLEGENEDCIKWSDEVAYVTAGTRLDRSGESSWNKHARHRLFTVDMASGTRNEIRNSSGAVISPSGRYLVYFDTASKNFFSYDREFGKRNNLTTGLQAQWVDGNAVDVAGSEHATRGVTGWDERNGTVYLYDQHDIWQIHLAGKSRVCLTNGFGAKNNIAFTFLQEGQLVQSTDKKNIVVSAFNLSTKENGFFRMSMTGRHDPKKLVMESRMYWAGRDPYIRGYLHFLPRKAAAADVYVVRRMSASEAPNFFVTKDFISFKQLTFVQPEKKYNWYTTELIRWKTKDGHQSQGILYKPENFDSTKKYPVIFWYYERKSNMLNAYLKPEVLSGGCSIDVATYVSNGYLVYIPDIYFTIGATGSSALKYVGGAAEYLSALPFVNGKKMGLQGCSFGGYLTNYLITHSQRFAAACSASGLSDFISGYNDITGGGASLQGMYEQGQQRLGKTLWEAPGEYIDNSPIFSTPDVITPLLMMHTTNDGVCPFPQAIEFFTALRRLGKRAWLLEYEDADHGVFGNQATDFATRMKQFFDHYLKDAPAPTWMTRGIPDPAKYVHDGLTPDKEICTPGTGLLINQWR